MNNPDSAYWSVKERRDIERRERERVAAEKVSANISLQDATGLLANRLDPYRIYLPRRDLRKQLREIFSRFVRMGYDGNMAYRLASDAIFNALITNQQSRVGNSLPPPAPLTPSPVRRMNAHAPAFIPRDYAAAPTVAIPFDEDAYINQLFAAEPLLPLKNEGNNGYATAATAATAVATAATAGRQSRRLRRRSRSRQSLREYSH